MGLLEEELSFSYLLDYSDIIAVGTITGTDVLNETRPVMTVFIEDPIVGKTEDNDLTVLTKEVKSLNVAEKQQESIPQFSTQQELESAADVIAHIEVTNIADDRGIATTYYELIESHKGNLDISPLLLPTNKIEEGKQYMLYLTRTGNDVFPVTRDSSIVEMKDTD